jgi:hypothetical protein
MTVRMPVRASEPLSVEMECAAQESPRRRIYAHQCPFQSNLHAKSVQWWRLLGKLFRPANVMLTLVVAAAWSGEGSDAADSPFASDEFQPKIENMQVNAGGTGNSRPAKWTVRFCF